MTGQEAKARRAHVGKPLRTVAKQAGMTHATLSRFERGLHRLHPLLQASLDDALGAFEREHVPEYAPEQPTAA